MSNRELMQQALDALKYHQEQNRPILNTIETIATLEAELAKPEQALDRQEEDGVQNKTKVRRLMQMAKRMRLCLSEHYDEAYKALQNELYIELAKPEQDWSLLKATQESLREHQARIKDLEAQLVQPDVTLIGEGKTEPVAWMQDSTELYVKDHHTSPYTIPLYAAPQKYCPSENNASYEKGFIEGMAKQMHSSVDCAVNAMSKPWMDLTQDEKTALFMQAEFSDLTERQMYDVVAAQLKEKNHGNKN